jgi:hypothetical protein
MSDMATWVHSVIISVGVAIVTVIITSLTVGPRLAARSKQIQADHDARYQFTNSILDLLALCANLRKVTISDATEEPRRSRLQAERDRWETQIGEIVIWLIDHWQRYALGYIRIARIPSFPNLITDYVFTVWVIWIDAGPIDDRIRMLQEFTEPMGEIFLRRRWHVFAIRRAARRLRRMLDDLDNSAAAEQPYEASRDAAAAL